MRISAKSIVAFTAVLSVLVSSIIAEPYYKSKEDYLNRQPSVIRLDRPATFKSSYEKAAASISGPPDIDAVWTGATTWMSGINWGGETYGGSIAKGINFFGSNIASGNYVPIRIIFQTGVPNQSLCRTFRRDLGYATGGVGTFPGQAYDISNPGSPRRLNICFVEDNNASPVNLAWDPNGTTGGSWPGKREYIYVMNSNYDGNGMTYNGTNGYTGASLLDILYNWWPLVASGHTFFENQPCTLTITPYYLRNMMAVPDTNKITLNWSYSGGGSVNHYNIYYGATSPANVLLDQVSSSSTRYVHSGLSNGQNYYYRVEADDAARSIIAKSKEVNVTTQNVASNLNLLDFWNDRGEYGGCWGYTDSATGHEYGLLACRNEGISIIDLDVSPIQEVGFMPLMTPGKDSKEVKVYGKYAIVISEYEPAQIFDISNVSAPVKIANVMNITGDGTNGAHNCMVDGNYLYVIGNHDVGGLQIWNITNPAAPASVGTFQPFYYHDVDIYRDTLIAFGIYGQGIDLVNIGNKASPSLIRRFNYPGSGSHNGEFLQGRQFVAIGDEIGTMGNHTRMFDLRDLDNINKIYDIIVDPSAVAHNCYARNDTLFIAHYTEGVRMWDVSNPFGPMELGHYDSFLPAIYGYYGVWNVFPYFASGRIIISDMQSGLFLLKPPTPPSCCVGTRGDFNGDAADANILDLTYLVDRIFRGGPASPCPIEADINSDSTPSNILDLTFLVDRIFRGGLPPGPC